MDSTSGEVRVAGEDRAVMKVLLMIRVQQVVQSRWPTAGGLEQVA
jgi:hypothetical protein